MLLSMHENSLLEEHAAANDFFEIQSLLQEKADYQARLDLIPCDGTPEVRESRNGRYLYRKELTMAIFDGNKLSEEELKEVQGGYLLDRGPTMLMRWYVIDNEGNRVDLFHDKWDAEQRCRELGLSTDLITSEQWDRLQKTGKIQ